VVNVFRGNFTQQEPIPEESIAIAIDVMRSGRLHRYNTVDGEIAEVVKLEQQFMDRLMALARRRGAAVIEDCAHTMGASWRGVPSGRHGVAACYSTHRRTSTSTPEKET
jgi:hypothetical protein